MRNIRKGRDYWSIISYTDYLLYKSLYPLVHPQYFVLCYLWMLYSLFPWGKKQEVLLLFFLFWWHNLAPNSITWKADRKLPSWMRSDVPARSLCSNSDSLIIKWIRTWAGKSTLNRYIYSVNKFETKVQFMCMWWQYF